MHTCMRARVCSILCILRVVGKRCARIDACLDERVTVVVCVYILCLYINAPARFTSVSRNCRVDAKVYVYERTSMLESRSDRIGNCTDASSRRDVSDVARFNASDTCGERSPFFCIPHKIHY